MSFGLIVMGLFIGFLVGMTGVGGAALLTPILILLGINPSIAVGTDLIYNSVTKFFGSIQHWRQKSINFQLVKYLAIGSIPSAILAVIILRVFDSFFQNQEQIIEHALGYTLILVAIATLVKTFMKEKYNSNRFQQKPLQEKRTMTICIGAVLGFMVGLTSIGSGSLFALAMLSLYKLRATELVGTDITYSCFLISISCRVYACGYWKCRLSTRLKFISRINPWCNHRQYNHLEVTSKTIKGNIGIHYITKWIPTNLIFNGNKY
jgi:uncharacterized membrane protein YfcA